MTELVQPRLVNPPDGDPGVYLDFRFGRRAMLFDLGDLATLTPRELLRVSHAFVSHAHMDHVAGFDTLLRLRLHRPRPLTLVGPAGFLGQTGNRLGAFTWNLLDATSIDFRLTVQEFDGRRLSAAAEFRAREGFRRRDMPPPDPGDGLVLAEDDFTVEAAALDHGIPSLAFALQENLRVNVWRTALDELGLPVGPWLDAAKTAVRAGAPDDERIEIPGHGEMSLGSLRQRVLRAAPGQRVAYVTDAGDTPANRERIVRLARRADRLFIETPFLEADRPLATATAHLTARTAGEIALAAGVRRVAGSARSRTRRRRRSRCGPQRQGRGSSRGCGAELGPPMATEGCFAGGGPCPLRQPSRHRSRRAFRPLAGHRDADRPPARRIARTSRLARQAVQERGTRRSASLSPRYRARPRPSASCHRASLAPPRAKCPSPGRLQTFPCCLSGARACRAPCPGGVSRPSGHGDDIRSPADRRPLPPYRSGPCAGIHGNPLSTAILLPADRRGVTVVPSFLRRWPGPTLQRRLP